MKLLTSSISRHNKYSQNHQRNVYHIKYNLVQGLKCKFLNLRDQTENIPNQ